jgi:hypothetical protein
METVILFGLTQIIITKVSVWINDYPKTQIRQLPRNPSALQQRQQVCGAIRSAV